jgi:hypothetical protein
MLAQEIANVLGDGERAEVAGVGETATAEIEAAIDRVMGEAGAGEVPMSFRPKNAGTSMFQSTRRNRGRNPTLRRQFAHGAKN